MAVDQRPSELQSHFIQERIKMVEKHFTDICHQVAAYANGVAHLRDSGDDLSKVIMNYALKENLNQSMKAALTRFSVILSGIQDYREAQILRLEGKVIQDLSAYGKICKTAKMELKHNSAVRSRELAKRQQLEKFHGKKPANWQQQAEKEYHRAVADSRESTKALEDRIDLFEAQKLRDVKRVLLEFINIEMLFHSKALELYTEAYNTISHISVEDDLQVFRDCFRRPSTQSRLDMVRATIMMPSSPETSIPPVTSPLRQSYSLGSRTVRGSYSCQQPRAPALSTPNRKLFSEPNMSLRYTDGSFTDSREDSSESDPNESARRAVHR